MGTKYVWFGNSYLSNMYHKMIAERPTYYWDKGGDNTFGYVDEQSDRAYISGDEGTGYRNVTNNYYTAVGDNTFGYVDEQSDRAHISGDEGTGYRNVTNNYYTAVGDIHGNPVMTRSW